MSSEGGFGLEFRITIGKLLKKHKAVYVNIRDVKVMECFYDWDLERSPVIQLLEGQVKRSLGFLILILMVGPHQLPPH